MYFIRLPEVLTSKFYPLNNSHNFQEPQVAYLMDYFFSSPKGLPGVQTVAVDVLEANPEISEHRGSLRCISPEEWLACKFHPTHF
jgi:hypothetical protein